MSQKPKTEARYVLRAQIIFKAAKGVSGVEIAKQLGISAGIISNWRIRFESERCDGLLDDFRPGRPPKIDFEKLRERLLDKLDELPPTAKLLGNTRANLPKHMEIFGITKKLKTNDYVSLRNRKGVKPTGFSGSFSQMAPPKKNPTGSPQNQPFSPDFT